MIYLLILILIYATLSIYQEYFQRKNKISDRLLMENYMFITMKKNNIKYYPNMEINYETN